MSRVGRRPIDIPDKTKVEVAGRMVKVGGPLGSLEATLPHGIELTVEGKRVLVGIPPPGRASRGFQGLARAMVANMVEGVTKGYERKLEISGVGYKAELKGDTLVFSLGYSHPIEFALPKGVTASLEKNTMLTVHGIDKQAIGQVAAQIRAFRKPEPYKGKGIKYADEQVRRKVGKAGAK